MTLNAQNPASATASRKTAIPPTMSAGRFIGRAKGNE